jgi:NADH dehydrogenase [ubiquinone] 1 alpha subcomplex assembly factor 7
VLVELSPALRERQREVLRDIGVRELSWAEQFAPREEQPLILIANEFFDALPIHQFVATREGWRERCVGFDGSALVFALSPAPVPRGMIPAPLRDAGEGAVVELAPVRNGLAAVIGETLAKEQGAALVIDYGFSGPAIGDTLQAMRAHAVHSVLADPGHADVTSHVDFAALCAGFAQGGADVYGPIAQGALLDRLGGHERTAALATRATTAQREALESGYKRLTEPEQMGSLFQALVAASPGLLPPGFAPYERR